MSERHTIQCDVCCAIAALECGRSGAQIPPDWSHRNGDDFCPSCTAAWGAIIANVHIVTATDATDAQQQREEE